MGLTPLFASLHSRGCRLPARRTSRLTGRRLLLLLSLTSFQPLVSGLAVLDPPLLYIGGVEASIVEMSEVDQLLDLLLWKVFGFNRLVDLMTIGLCEVELTPILRHMAKGTMNCVEVLGHLDTPMGLTSRCARSVKSI